MVEDKVRFIDHKGKKILFLEFTGTKDEELQILENARHIIDKQPPKSLRIITDMNNVVWDNEGVHRLKEFTRLNTPFVKYSAVVGVTGLKKVILMAVKQFSHRDFILFDDVESAKDWIAEQQ